ncbi:MAG: porphobilinogen synthase, partial [bacterium]|nr:porphobilinogen synthase [bacterium]
MQIAQRPRRNRNCQAIRALVCETVLTPRDLVYPLFVTEGKGVKVEIASMPGCFRLSLDQLLICAREAHSLGIQAVALF